MARLLLWLGLVLLAWPVTAHREAEGPEALGERLAEVAPHGRAAANASEARDLAVLPASELEVRGIKTSVLAVLKDITDVITTFVGEVSNMTTIAGGVVVMVGDKGVSSGLLDFISWAGIAAAGYDAVDAAVELAQVSNGCIRMVAGIKLVVNAGAVGVGLASVLGSLAGIPSAVAGIGLAIMDQIWMVLEEKMRMMCSKSKTEGDVEVTLPVTPTEYASFLRSTQVSGAKEAFAENEEQANQDARDKGVTLRRLSICDLYRALEDRPLLSAEDLRNNPHKYYGVPSGDYIHCGSAWD